MLAAPLQGRKTPARISVRGYYLVLPSATMEEAFQPKMSKLRSPTGGRRYSSLESDALRYSPFRTSINCRSRP